MAAIRTAPVRLLMAAVITVLLSLWIGSQHPAYAANFIVDSTADAVDANPGDGVCDDGAGRCTLRAAIQETNSLPGADTITLPAGTYTLTIPGTGEDAAATGDLDITDDLTLTGADRVTTVIDGGAIDRVIHSALDGQSITVTISGVSIQNGRTSFSGGAGIFNGRFGLGLLELRSVFVRNNIVAGPGGSGGGIHNIGVVSLEDVIVHNNDGFVTGGGIFNQGTLTISASTVRDNVTNSTGGGIDSGGTATVIDSTISHNFAGHGAGGGGGVNNFGEMEIFNSTVSANHSDKWGGGLSNSGGLRLTNVTVSGNTAAGDGGGIRNHSLGRFTLINVTVSGNVADGEGGGIFSLAGPFSGKVTLKNSLLAHNASSNCAGAGPIISQGHNLDSGNTCNFAGPGDLVNTDPLLGSLADNGGPTQTHALLSGSPAIDAGSDDCPPPATDQRGLPRPTDGDADGTSACDIGAYEVACAGDLNRDGTVDGRDVRVVARALFSRPGQMRWDTTADINTDGRVDRQDLFIVLHPPGDAGCHLAAPS